MVRLLLVLLGMFGFIGIITWTLREDVPMFGRAWENINGFYKRLSKKSPATPNDNGFMRIVLMILLFVFILIATGMAHAGDGMKTVKIFTGGEKSAYTSSATKMVNYLRAKKIALEIIHTGGTLDNLARLSVETEQAFAFAQGDAPTMPEWKTSFIPIAFGNIEVLHIIVPKSSDIGYWSELKDKTVAVGADTGGTWQTVRLLQGYTKVSFLPNFGETGILSAQILSGNVHAGMFVGVKKHPAILSMNPGEFKLAEFDEFGALKNAKRANGEPIYEPVPVINKDYPNMKWGMFRSSVELPGTKMMLITNQEGGDASTLASAFSSTNH